MILFDGFPAITLYIVFAIIVPKEDIQDSNKNNIQDKDQYYHNRKDVSEDNKEDWSDF